ncbi:FAD-binding oxidoreductase [Amaricoccus sp.]|uniref:FAD-binding oxidoreductase n=1 Tax=Amaricoccus sp. TaxID=1872485 RepID=UPI001B4D07DD|nr:FAD-binding oxidoreductase [Amaricoccus sp.]MBP7001480.1 FAD-binding oxidoreductase [Amaricoccus sp.]
MADLNPAHPAFLARLESALGAGAVRPPEPRHLEEPRGRRRGRVAAVALPASTAEVARVVALCAEARVGIVPFGGGTGLVGGHTPMEGPLPVLLSLERMTRIRELDPVGGVAIVDAGCVLADVQAAARAAGRLFPLSLASEGSARIGGLLAANAGGVGVLRYGNARDLCLGIEAVMADGSVMHGLAHVLKDNLGYDLRHLIIGSEGTLAVITGASLRLHPLPAETAAAWAPVPGPAEALALLALMRARLGQAISAFELIHRAGIDFLGETVPHVAIPQASPSDWIVLVEVADGPGAAVGPRLEEALAAAIEEGLATDALVAQNEAQRRAFWTVRETIPEANRLIGSVSSHDVALPPARLPEFLAAADAAVAAIDPGMRINAFGHLGDGNLHYNVFPARGRPRADYDAVKDVVKATVHDLVHAFGGSVAAEHGVGRIKLDDMTRYADPAKLRAMRAIKDALDPLGILNPGAALPPA